MTSATPGLVLVLNGTSSAGKSAVARSLQEQWRAPLLDAGLDRHLSMLPERYLGADWPEVFRYHVGPDGVIDRVTPGPVAELLVAGMHRAVAALASSGLDVVVDHVLLTPAWAADLAAALSDVRAALVGVHCPVDVLAQRERDRANRTLGQAAAQQPFVHAHGAYDVEVDTSLLTPDAAADTVVAWLARAPSLTALDRLDAR